MLVEAQALERRCDPGRRQVQPATDRGALRGPLRRKRRRATCALIVQGRLGAARWAPGLIRPIEDTWKVSHLPQRYHAAQHALVSSWGTDQGLERAEAQLVRLARVRATCWALHLPSPSGEGRKTLKVIPYPKAATKTTWKWLFYSGSVSSNQKKRSTLTDRITFLSNSTDSGKASATLH